MTWFYFHRKPFGVVSLPIHIDSLKVIGEFVAQFEFDLIGLDDAARVGHALVQIQQCAEMLAEAAPEEAKAEQLLVRAFRAVHIQLGGLKLFVHVPVKFPVLSGVLSNLVHHLDPSHGHVFERVVYALLLDDLGGFGHVVEHNIAAFSCFDFYSILLVAKRLPHPVHIESVVA